MLQFNFYRFRKLARWSLTIDSRWFVKNTLSWLVVFTLMFLFFTCVARFNSQPASLPAYGACTSMVLFTTVAILVLGPTMMFNSMRGKHDDQRLMTLPASNLEKYLMRYSYWLLLLPSFVGSFVVADLLQYLVNWLLGHEGRMLVMQYMGSRAQTLGHLHRTHFRMASLVLCRWRHVLPFAQIQLDHDECDADSLRCHFGCLMAT